LEGHVPIYEYRCSSCGFQKEYLQKVSDPLLSSCPECGRESFQKMLTTAGFQLKGSGWYATDFKGAGAKPRIEKTGSATKATDSAKVAESAKGTESAKAADSAKAGESASGAGAAAASTVAESGS
jgi:putative FmdB family regulatory protein